MTALRAMPKKTVSVTLDQDLIIIIENGLCSQWRTNRSGAIQRIITEWLADHPEALKPDPLQINSEEIS